MAHVSSILRQLKQERDRVERQLTGLNAALTAFAGGMMGQAEPEAAEMSVAARKKMAAEQRRRWATFRKSKS